MRPSILLVLSLSTLAWTGCPSIPPRAKPSTPAGVTAPDPKPANDAQAASDAAAQERLSKLSANVNAAATAPNIEASPVAVNELTVAQGRLSDVKPDPVEVAAAAERRALQEAGRAAEARQNAEAAAGQGRRDAIRIAELQATATSERARADAAVAAYAAQAEKNRIENQKAIDAALAKAKQAIHDRDNAVLKDQIAWCNKIGFSALGIAVALLAGAWFFGGGLLGLKKLGPVVALVGFVGVAALWLARILGNPWFMPVLTFLILGVLTWIAVWMVRHYRQKDLAAEVQARTAKLAAVAKDVVPVLDAAYENGRETVDQLAERVKAKVKALRADGVATAQDVLDELVFDPISSKMDATTKATVKEIRAIPAIPAGPAQS